MMNTATEKTLSKIIGVGLFTTIVFLINGTVTDPVNAPKLFVLGAFAFAILFFIARYLIEWIKLEGLLLAGVSLIFLVTSLSAVVFSSGPLSQNLYGSYGRNNGLLMYLFLLIFFLATAMLQSKDSIKFLAISFYLH